MFFIRRWWQSIDGVIKTGLNQAPADDISLFGQMKTHCPRFFEVMIRACHQALVAVYPWREIRKTGVLFMFKLVLNQAPAHEFSILKNPRAFCTSELIV